MGLVLKVSLHYSLLTNQDIFKSFFLDSTPGLVRSYTLFKFYDYFVSYSTFCLQLRIIRCKILLTFLLRGALFIFRVLATLNVLRCHLIFALESLTFFIITTFRTFCRLSVICVVYNDLTIVSQKKIGINPWKFSLL